MPEIWWWLASGGDLNVFDAVFELNPLNDLGQTV